MQALVEDCCALEDITTTRHDVAPFLKNLGCHGHWHMALTFVNRTQL
jgi:hypothetical protein